LDDDPCTIRSRTGTSQGVYETETDVT
jgi:hypothetical protein